MTHSTSLPRRRLRRTRAATALAAAGALIMSVGILGLVASPALADKGEGHTHGNSSHNDNGNGNAGNAPGHNKVGICHRTGSTTNRYVYIEVPAVKANGHLTGTGKQHNRNLTWPAGSVWRGVEMSGVILDYLAPGGRADCEDTTVVVDEVDFSVVPIDPCGTLEDELSVGGVRVNSSGTVTEGGVQYDVTISGSSWSVVITALDGKELKGTGETTLTDEGSFTDEECPPVGLEEISPAVTFTDPDCDNLNGADWDGNLDSILDYTVTGDVDAGETIIVEAEIEPDLTDQYEFAEDAETRFVHTFDDVTLSDCVLGEETIVPSPKPDKEPTVKGVEAVKPPAAAPTAVAAGIGGPSESPLATVARMLVAGGMLLLVAGAWIGLGRREFGSHEA